MDYYPYFTVLNSTNGAVIGSQYEFSEWIWRVQTMVVFGDNIFMILETDPSSLIATFDMSTSTFGKTVTTPYSNLVIGGPDDM